MASVDELHEAARAGKVRTVRGFGPKTEASIIAALDAYARRARAIRWVDAREEIDWLAAFVRAQRGVVAVDEAGAVRRFEEEIDELALVATVEGERAGLAVALAEYPPLARVASKDADRVVGRLANGVRVVVRLTHREQRGVALVEETGPPGACQRPPDARRSARRSVGGAGRPRRGPSMPRSTSPSFRPRREPGARFHRPPIDTRETRADIQKGSCIATRPILTGATRWKRWPAPPTPLASIHDGDRPLADGRLCGRPHH